MVATISSLFPETPGPFIFSCNWAIFLSQPVCVVDLDYLDPSVKIYSYFHKIIFYKIQLIILLAC